MKFPCPYCHRELDLMEMSHASDLAAIIAMSVAFGKHHRLVWTYAELFGITPLHAKAKKLRLLLDEMKKLFDAGGFSYQKRRYAISAEGIVEALGIVVKKSFPDPLDSHNYLKKVMISIADREAKAAGRTVEKDLRGREGKLMAGIRDVDDPVAGGDPGIDPYPVVAEQVEALRAPAVRRPESAAELAQNQDRLRSIIDRIGGKDPSRRQP